MVFSHAFAGAALTKAALRNVGSKFTTKQINFFYVVGIFASVLPDFDIIYIFIDKTVMHRYLISHSAIPYLIISIVPFAYGFVKNNSIIKYTAAIFLIGVSSHLILDLFIGGTVLLAPIYDMLYGFNLNLPRGRTDWALAYVSSPYMIGEALLFVIYYLVCIKKKYVTARLLPIIFFIISVIALILLSLFC